MREGYGENTEENTLVLAEMRCSQEDSVAFVEFRAEPHGGIGFIKNLDIISISFSAYNMIIAE